VHRPRASNSIRASADGEAAIRVSLHRDGLLNGLRRKPAQAVFTPICQDQANRLAEAGAALLYGVALPIRARHLGRPGNEPFTVPFNDRGELIAHG